MISMGLPLSLAIIMLSLGIGLEVSDFRRVALNGYAFVIGAVSQVILLPLAAFGIASLCSLPPEIAVGFMLLSFCPGGVTSNILSKWAGGDVALSISLTAVISLLSILTVPVFSTLAITYFMGADAPPVNVTAWQLNGTVFEVNSTWYELWTGPVDGTNTTIDFGGGNLLALEGVLVADLHPDDFIFPSSVINGTPFDDIPLNGTSDADTINGLDGNDSIVAGDGDDVVDGGNGDDTLQGVPGADSLNGQAGHDCAEYIDSNAAVNVNLQAGTATGGSATGDTLTSIEGIIGSNFNDTLTGDAGGNHLIGNQGTDLLTGNEGDDTMVGGDGNDTIFGGDNNDTITGDAGADTIEGEAGDDTIDAGADDDTVHGGTGADSIAGGTGADVITGGDGDDTVDGGDGDDTIDGGLDNDSISAGLGNDSVDGGDGNDTIDAGDGVNNVDGGAGADSIVSGTGDDNITGGAGNDTVDAGAGSDSILGNDGDDSLTGGAGNDTILGGLNNDFLDGGDDADTLLGEDGDDTIVGGTGADTIVGGAGGNKEPVAEPVEVFHRGGVHRFLHRQLGGQPFGPAGNGAADMQMGGQRGAAGQDEAAQRLQVLVHGVDFGFQPLHLGVSHAQRRVVRLGVVFHVRAAEIGAQVKQVVLDPGQRRIRVPFGFEAGNAKKGVQLVGRAVGRDPGGVFGHAVAIAEGGVALVAGTRVDFVQNNHAVTGLPAGADIRKQAPAALQQIAAQCAGASACWRTCG